MGLCFFVLQFRRVPSERFRCSAAWRSVSTRVPFFSFCSLINCVRIVLPLDDYFDYSTVASRFNYQHLSWPASLKVAKWFVLVRFAVGGQR